MDEDVAQLKREWRRRGRRARADRRARRHRLDADRTRAALASLAGVETVCTYLSCGDEPGTLDLARELHQRGARVLVPVLTDGHGHGLGRPAWGWYDPDALRLGLWGIPEPNGTLLEVGAIGEAQVVLCSALWVDRQGYRVGVGGGWYDRALGSRRPGASVWAVVDDEDVVDRVPREPWDVPVDAVLTPSGLRTPIAAPSAYGMDGDFS